MKSVFQKVGLNLIREPVKAARTNIVLESLTELAESMKHRGQLQPIILLKSNDGYEIEAGHRRFLAAQMLGWSVIDAMVKEATDDDSLHLDRAHENLIREDLNPVEESKIVWDLVYEDGRGVERCASLLCKTVSWVETRLEIYKFPDDIKEAIALGAIKVAVAKELVKVKNEETRERLLKSAIEYGASAAVVKQWCSDTQVVKFLEQSEVAAAGGDAVAINHSQVSMPCRICDVSHMIDILRHIWICPECMGAMRELARETQKQLRMIETGITEE
mgnify:CR=1 FL=1